VTNSISANIGILPIHLATSGLKGPSEASEALKKYVQKNQKGQEMLVVTEGKWKGQLVVRKDMDVNEHERIFNITLRHKLK
jgi:hypothetical protein